MKPKSVLTRFLVLGIVASVAGGCTVLGNDDENASDQSEALRHHRPNPVTTPVTGTPVACINATDNVLIVGVQPTSGEIDGQLPVTYFPPTSLFRSYKHTNHTSHLLSV